MVPEWTQRPATWRRAFDILAEEPPSYDAPVPAPRLQPSQPAVARAGDHRRRRLGRDVDRALRGSMLATRRPISPSVRSRASHGLPCGVRRFDGPETDRLLVGHGRRRVPAGARAQADVRHSHPALATRRMAQHPSRFCVVLTPEDFSGHDCTHRCESADRGKHGRSENRPYRGSVARLEVLDPPCISGLAASSSFPLLPRDLVPEATTLRALDALHVVGCRERLDDGHADLLHHPLRGNVHAIVSPQTALTPSSEKPLSTSACAPSVAYPLPQASWRSR